MDLLNGDGWIRLGSRRVDGELFLVIFHFERELYLEAGGPS